MRNLSLALVALALCACGASSKEVAMAKTARYQGDKLMLFAETKAAVESGYKIQNSDEVGLSLVTVPRWFTPDGLAANDAGDVSMMQDRSLRIGMTVQVLPEGSNWIVKVTPRILRYNRGSPQPEPVNEGDISLPNWVGSRTDELALDIHKQLAKYEVKSGPQMIPAGDQPPPASDSSAGAAPGADTSGGAAPGDTSGGAAPTP